MASQAKIEPTIVSKTQHYLKVKKPLLERQRRARMNKCLDTLKTLVAEFQGDDAILRLDKAEMLEAALVFMRKQVVQQQAPVSPLPMNSFRNGYMNAVSEISRVMACSSTMSVDIGKTVMTHLGVEFQRMLQSDQHKETQLESSMRPASPASSGYQSDVEESEAAASPKTDSMWRPW
ncbi:enhancer of split m5 protein [Drosophila guanche]|uniref:Blast:Enhancer of split m5 protein n=1 Tax=Drosophila guanche TaxID=7266 RepID=A0A3B0KSB1_DROGU|nr:enhancer of split m5 protein [Drosophila guanche]SPP89579.1 blast:Enhancer of split m5 protein [Drosophila guanche]